MTQSTAHPDWLAAHGKAFVLLMACAWLIPSLRGWPWVWLAPLTAYFLLVVCVRPLRRSFRWLHAGRLSPASIVATIAVMALTVFALILFHSTIRSDPHGYSRAVLSGAFGSVIMRGVVFTIVNATLEELVFRGVLFDALQLQWGIRVTLVGTALLFGLGHLRGYPSGILGACLAALFGLAMGVLRLWTGGQALPIAAHMAADATIYSILVRS